MVSQTAEYALRAVVCLGTNPGTPLTTQKIAEQTKVPPSYLSKVMQNLARAGLVSSQRGLNGGFSLSRPLNELTVLDVVNAVDPLKRITKCPLGISGHSAQLCALHAQLDQAIADAERLFSQHTLEELIDGSLGKQMPLCERRAPKKSR